MDLGGSGHPRTQGTPEKIVAGGVALCRRADPARIRVASLPNQFIPQPEKAMPDPLYKQMTAFLLEAGIGDVSHTGKTYMGHLLALHRLLEERGCPPDVCRAGMFHSIYGTEVFQGFKLPVERRPDLRALIGERAERLAYLNCAMDRDSFDKAIHLAAPPYPVRDRLTGLGVELDQADFDDLCRIHLYDWLEQAPRSQRGYGYRRAAYRRMAERLGPAAVADYDAVFAAEPTPAP